MITPIMDAKTHGTGAKIDGFLDSDKGKVVLLIDDLVTKADSKLEAAEILISNGLVVNDVVVLVDREQGGGEELAKRSLTLHSAITITQMLDFFARVGKISIDDRAKIDQGLQDLNANFLLTR